MYSYLSLLLLILLHLSGCNPTPPGPHNPIYEPVEQEACVAAGANLERMKCRQAKLLSGKPFAQFCMEKMKANIPLAPRCISKIETATAPECPEVDLVCNP